MKLIFNGLSRVPLGRCITEILEIVRQHGWKINQLMLLSRNWRRDLDEKTILEDAFKSSSDVLEIRGNGFKINLHWLYGPRAKYFHQSLGGTLTVESSKLGPQVEMIEELFASAGVFYGHCDSEQRLLADADLSSRKGNPTLHLLRPYWLIYLGNEYRQAIPADSLKSLGVEIRETSEHGSRLVFMESPESPDEKRLKKVKEIWPVFIVADPPGGFKAPVVIGLEEIQGIAPPVRRRESLATLLIDVNEFISAVPRRREAALLWAEEHGHAIATIRDLIKLARRFEGQIFDEQELLLNFIALYGELIRESCSGRWSVGTLLNRGEPIIRYGLFGLSRHRVVLDFLECFGP